METYTYAYSVTVHFQIIPLVGTEDKPIPQVRKFLLVSNTSEFLFYTKELPPFLKYFASTDEIVIHSVEVKTARQQVYLVS